MGLKRFEQRLKILSPGLLELPILKKRGVTKANLGCYNPGGGRRYQIEFINDKGQEVLSLPNYHIAGKDFAWFLEGISEVLFYMKGN